MSETKPLAIEFRAAPVSKLRMAIPTTPSGMTTVKQIRILVRIETAQLFKNKHVCLFGAVLIELSTKFDGMAVVNK